MSGSSPSSSEGFRWCEVRCNKWQRAGAERTRGWLTFSMHVLVFILMSFIFLKYTGLVLRNPAPLCSWRLSQSLNVAWTDTQASHHSMVMFLNEGEEYTVESESLPYSRFFSFQTYSLDGKTSYGILRDAEIVSQNGPNLYANISAAAGGEKQGGYTLYLTPDGSKGYPNELQTLKYGQKSGFFVLIFRIYDVGDFPHPMAPWAHLSRGDARQPQRWGWTPPPRVSVRRTMRQGSWREIPSCVTRQGPDGKLWSKTYILGLTNRLEDIFPPSHSYTGFIKPLRQNNFHLPHDHLFSSVDTRTLVSAAAIPAVDVGDVWARVEAKLPRTPSSLYSPPFIANQSDYDVRYISFTSASRAFPLWTFETLTDKSIRQHYESRLRGPHEQWDGRFSLWIGPVNAPPPEQARLENALIMRWGEVARPALLYNQLLSSSRAASGAAPPTLANVVVNECPRAAEHDNHDEEDEDGSFINEGNVCCLSEPRGMPTFCRMPEFLHLNLREYFPAVTFFSYETQDEHGPTLRKISM